MPRVQATCARAASVRRGATAPPKEDEGSTETRSPASIDGTRFQRGSLCQSSWPVAALTSSSIVRSLQAGLAGEQE